MTAPFNTEKFRDLAADIDDCEDSTIMQAQAVRKLLAYVQDFVDQKKAKIAQRKKELLND